mgnify:CR=1 FL=1
MAEISEHGADGSFSADPDSGFALLGFDISPAASTAPEARVPRAVNPAISAATSPAGPAVQAHAEQTHAEQTHSEQTHSVQPRVAGARLPLTRRELRAREQAEAAQSALVVQAPAPVLPVQVPPQTTMQSSVQSSVQASVQAAAIPAPAAQPQEAQPTRRSASSKSASKAKSPKVKAPRKPKSLRPVKPPRGTSRPRPSAPPRGASVPRSRQKSLKRQMLSKLMTLGAMVGAGLMMVSTSIPANAFYPVQATTGTTVAATAAPVVEKAQSISVQAAAGQTVTRDNYTALSLRESLFLKYGNRNWSYTNDPNGTIQWPFPVAVPITDGYGPRIAPCGGCSTFHRGVDFTPGYGAAIQAIADGVVSSVDNGDWSYGENVMVDHVINGQKVQSLYAHMMRGSIRVVVGQQVKVGDEIGQVGSTGESTGPHLHLEIHVNGVPVDPFEWLKANAN